MSRTTPLWALVAALAIAGCVARESDQSEAAADGEPGVIAVQTAPVVQQPVRRFVHVSGTLAAQEDAEVAAEVAGRVMATPIERGSDGTRRRF